MARSSSHNVGRTYELMRGFPSRCLVGEGSVLGDRKGIWTLANLKDVHVRFAGDGAIQFNEDAEGKPLSFDDKLKIQFLANPDQRKLPEKYQAPPNASDDVRRLMAEILLVHVLILWDGAMSRRRKKETVELLCPDLCNEPEELFGSGILHPGQGFIKGYTDVRSILDLALALKSKAPVIKWPADESTHETVLAAIGRVDDQVEMTERARHAIWHLCFPDWFENCVSQTHRRQIRDAFAAFIEGGPAGDGVHIGLDRDLYAIRKGLEKQDWAESLKRPGGGGADRKSQPVIDFYHAPMWRLWNQDRSLLLSVLKLKGQVVLYGPPGTGKSYAARQLALALLLDAERSRVEKEKGTSEAVRHLLDNGDQLRKEWFDSPDRRRVHRVQLHPAYSYESFIGGHLIGDGGKVIWQSGSFLRLLEAMGKLKGPHVLILDEINRTDLSRLFGEAFSALEDRGARFEIPGASDVANLVIPKDLYVIGTMNEIDHSLEQVDFALRRRFAWHRCDFDADLLTERLDQLYIEHVPKELRARWDDRAGEEFGLVVQRAIEINQAIGANDRLGPKFAIGHAYYFILPELIAAEGGDRNTFLFGKRGATPPLERLWNLALRPLLESYMAGAEVEETRRFLDDCARLLLRGRDES